MHYYKYLAAKIVNFSGTSFDEPVKNMRFMTWQMGDIVLVAVRKLWLCNSSLSPENNKAHVEKY